MEGRKVISERGIKSLKGAQDTWEKRERAGRGASGVGGRSRQRFWGEQGCGELGHCPECTRGPLRGFEQGVAVQIC